MAEKINNIAKNTSYLTFALVLQKIISFTYFTLLARNLGAENLGKYYFAISFVTIFGVFIDLGLVNVLTREIAKRKNEAGKLLGSIITIKLPLAILALISVILTINILNYPPLIKNLVYLASICMVADSFTNTFFAVARGFHNLLFESISSVLFQLIVMAVGLTAVYMDMSLIWIMGAMVLASIFNFSYSSIIICKKIKVKIKPNFDKTLIKSIINLSIPFGLFTLFQRFYMYFDSVLLSILAGDKYVGYYQVAFKIVFALQFLPLAFIASLYPAMSNYWINNKKQLSTTFERAINYLAIISLPISVGVIVLADKIILVFKSDFLGAVIPMQVIMFSLFFIFINFPIGSLLNACDKQKKNTFNIFMATVLSITLNLILIPRFQATGASITVLITNALMTIFGFYWVNKTIDYNKKRVLKTMAKTFICAIFMGTLVFYLKTYLNIFVVIILGGIFYFILLFILKGFKKEDVISVYNSIIPKIKNQ